jgi:hypothetical protein
MYKPLKAHQVPVTEPAAKVLVAAMIRMGFRFKNYENYGNVVFWQNGQNVMEFVTPNNFKGYSVKVLTKILQALPQYVACHAVSKDRERIDKVPHPRITAPDPFERTVDEELVERHKV